METLLFAKDVAWDLTKPCDDCPFRRNAPDHAGVLQAIPAYLDSLQASRFSHTCHKTDNREGCDGPRNYSGQPQHCAGALHFVIRAGVDLQLPLLQAAERGALDIEAAAQRARRDESIFGTVGELLDYYAAMALRFANGAEVSR